jgi:hypothetical protein
MSKTLSYFLSWGGILSFLKKSVFFIGMSLTPIVFAQVDHFQKTTKKLLPSSTKSPKAKKAFMSLSKAKKGLLKVRERGYEWTTTAILVYQSERDYKSKNYEKSILKSKRALQEISHGLEQANYADEHWKTIAQSPL